MASNRRWFWVSKNTTQYSHDVVLHVGTKRPSKDKAGDWALGDDDAEICTR